MNDDRKGGLALIAGAVLLIVTMAFHPTGHDLFEPGKFEAMARLAAFAHALGLTSLFVTFLGALALTRRTDAADRLALAALVAYGFAALAGMIAATINGFVAPDLVRDILAGPARDDERWKDLLHYHAETNHAFAELLVVASSAAIVLWSAAILKNRSLARALGIYGLLLGPAVVLPVTSGHLHLDVHGFGLIVLLQSAWFVVAGILLWGRAATSSVAGG